MRQRKYLNINTPKELSLQLGVDLKLLQRVADNISEFFTPAEEPDKKGKIRNFNKPHRELRIIQRAINQKLLDKIIYPESIQGGIAKRSILTNAQIHEGKKNIACFDIKNFFPSIDYHVIYNVFREQKCAPNVAKLLTQLTTADGVLPQGFGTSPKISGLVLLKIDRRLANLFKAYCLKHSFWIDDLTISGNYPIRQLTKLIEKIFRQSGFKLNDKTRYAQNSEQQKVTGLTINAKANVPKKWREQLRLELHICNKYGIAQYLNAHSITIDPDSYLRSLGGRVAFYTSIRPDKTGMIENYRELISKMQKPIKRV
jgi:hypothetical protein